MPRTNTAAPADDVSAADGAGVETPWWLSTTVMLAMLAVVFVALPRLYAVDPLVGFAVSTIAVGYASYAVYRLLGIYRSE
jgi:hypothetical protein